MDNVLVNTSPLPTISRMLRSSIFRGARNPRPLDWMTQFVTAPLENHRTRSIECVQSLTREFACCHPSPLPTDCRFLSTRTTTGSHGIDRA